MLPVFIKKYLCFFNWEELEETQESTIIPFDKIEEALMESNEEYGVTN